MAARQRFEALQVVRQMPRQRAGAADHAVARDAGDEGKGVQKGSGFRVQGFTSSFFNRWSSIFNRRD